MKLSEFEEKLKTVSDDKVRQMLASSRRDGPEVATKLILAEANRRGLNIVDDSDSPTARSESMEASRATQAHELPIEPEPSKPWEPSVPTSLAEASPADSSANPDRAASPHSALALGDEPSDSSSPNPPEWLSEETTKSKVHPLFKVAIYLAVLGAAIGAAFKFLRH